MLCDFQYLAPRSRDELLGIMAEHGAAARLLAGGTDLLTNIRNGLVAPEFVVNLKLIPGYDQMVFDKNKGLEIGPAVLVNDLVFTPDIAENYPLLKITAAQLASYQLRNRATVVGNIANASPCADLAPALLCLDASVVISSKGGSRTVAVKDFFTGVKKTVVKEDEVVEKIQIPAASTGFKGGYKKLKRIKGHDLGIVGVALAKTPDSFRIAVSSAAPTPVLVKDYPLDSSTDQLVAGTLETVSPISDIRGSKDYRLFMIGEFVKQLHEECK